jgi:hypothetical protein
MSQKDAMAFADLGGTRADFEPGRAGSCTGLPRAGDGTPKPMFLREKYPILQVAGAVRTRQRRMRQLVLK